LKIPVRKFAQAGVGFGTSGVRATVEALTDEVCFAYAAAFLDAVVKVAERPAGATTVAIAHDLRPSSPRMVAACVAACEARGAKVTHCGPIPTPALAHHCIQRRVPGIMVTGSHIPFDRNGIKFYTAEGEILKDDEAAIAAAEVEVDEGLFDGARLRTPPALPAPDPAARALYVDRYLDFFPAAVLNAKKVGVYEHSSIARDLIKDVLARLGAEVVSLGRTDTFVPIDTEAVSEADQRQATAWAAEHGLDALVSTDGDADRPLVGDEKGTWLRGDVVGMLCAGYLGAGVVVTPVSSNSAVERWGRFKVVRTRIGSPYVIAGMLAAARGASGPVVGYEANGGFLLGSPVRRGVNGASASLAALPTRDALLPMLAVLAMAAERGGPVSGLLADLPARFTASDRIQNVPTEASRALLRGLTGDPAALEGFFGDLGRVTRLDQLDGLRATLSTGEVVHLRPSGNAPELRCYAEAGTPARAAELARWGLRAAARQMRMG
jgi:phosphomannomutase